MPKDNGVFHGDLALKYAHKGHELNVWKEFERPWLKDILKKVIFPPLNPNTVKAAEIGCGGGKTLGVLLEVGIQPENITGLEPSSELASYAKAQFPNINIIRALSQDFRFPRETFDLVTLVNVIHLLSDIDLEKTMSNIWHSLSKNGVFVILSPIHTIDLEQKVPGITDLESKNVPWTETEKVPMYPRMLGEIFGSITNPDSNHQFQVVVFNELLDDSRPGPERRRRLGFVAVKLIPERHFTISSDRFGWIR